MFAVPDFALIARELDHAIHRLHRGVGQIRKLERCFQALKSKGDVACADEVLRDYIAHNPYHGSARGMALLYRAALRWDFSCAENCEPLLKRALAYIPSADRYSGYVLRGLNFVNDYRPEKPLFTTNHEVQNIVEPTWRALKQGTPEDVERAMRDLGSVLRGSGDALLRITDEE